MSSQAWPLRGPALLLAAGSRSRARHYAPSLRSLAAGWPLVGHYAAPLPSLEAVGRAYPRDVVAGVATQRGPALLLAARSGFARLGTTRLRSCSAGRLHLITTSFCAASRPNKRGPWHGRSRAAKGGPYSAEFNFFLIFKLWPPERKNLNGGTLVY